jgi:hypothetical protein
MASPPPPSPHSPPPTPCPQCSEFLRKRLHNSVMKYVRQTPRRKHRGEDNVADIAQAALPESFSALDTEFLALAKRDSLDDGSTALVCVCVGVGVCVWVGVCVGVDVCVCVCVCVCVLVAVGGMVGWLGGEGDGGLRQSWWRWLWQWRWLWM